MNILMRGCIILFFVVFVPSCGLLLDEGREVVAEVGGEPIRLRDLQRRIRSLPFEVRAKANDAEESVCLNMRRFFLKGLINEKLFLMEAEARGIQVSDEEIENAFNRNEEHEEALDDVVNTMEDDGAERHDHTHGGEGHSSSEINLMREKFMIEKLKDMLFSDEALRKYYDDNMGDFGLPTPLLSYEIVSVESIADGAVIDRIYRKAIQEGITLNEALESLKDVPQNIAAVTIPLIAIPHVAPELRGRLENLKVGETATPFTMRTNGKEHRIALRLVEYTDKAPFENIKERLHDKLYGKFVDELIEKYKVTIYADKLDYKVG